jgi:hypothetical protein
MLIGLLAVALVLFGATLALVLPRHCPVNRAAFERIKPGMTRAEVHAILGGPPGDYRTRPSGPFTLFFDSTVNGIIPLAELWQGDEGGVCVEYSASWDTPPTATVAVWRARFKEADPYHPSLLEMIRWRLNRLLGREPD